MEERPPILRWKVVLALFVVVAVGVTLGSVLNSTAKHENTVYSAYVTLQRAEPMGTPMRPIPINPCAKATFHTVPKPEKSVLRLFREKSALRLFRTVCPKHR